MFALTGAEGQVLVSYKEFSVNNTHHPNIGNHHTGIIAIVTAVDSRSNNKHHPMNSGHRMNAHGISARNGHDKFAIASGAAH